MLSSLEIHGHEAIEASLSSHIIDYVCYNEINTPFFLLLLVGWLGRGLDRFKGNLPTGGVSVVGRIGIGIRSKY